MLNKNDGALECERVIDGKKYYLQREKATDKFWHAEEEIEGWPQHYELVIAYSDLKKVYYIPKDYPDGFSKEDREIFDEEQPFWKGYFSGR